MAWRQPQMASQTPAAVQNEGKGVEGSKSGVIQNENLHILEGSPRTSAVDGAKSGTIQDENLHILKGEVVEGFKAEIPKPAKARRQEPKALKDLSQARKPVLSAASKATAPKDESTAAIREAAKEAQKRENLTDEQIAECQEWAEEARKRYNLTDEQIAKCQKLAEEGIEYMPCTYNDMSWWAMSDLWESTDMTSFGVENPVKEVPSDTEDTLQWKFEPEVLPWTPRARRASSPEETPTDYEESAWTSSVIPRAFELS